MYVDNFILYSLTFVLSLRYSRAECGGDIVDLEGVITSPGFPSEYPENIRCKWTIIAPSNYHTKLDFDYFKLDGSDTDCSKSSKLRVTKEYEDGHKISVFCGKTIDKYIISTSKRVSIELITVDDISAVGFKMRYKLEECGGTKRGKGVLSTPFYPFMLNKVLCIYIITLDEPGRIQLVFKSFHIEGQDCLKNSVMIEVINKEDVNNTGKHCGHELPVTYFFDTTGYLKITLKIETEYTSHGFIAHYQTDKCGAENISEPIGYIYSPMYPDFYEPNKICVWNIYTKDGNHVNLYFDRFVIKAPNIEAKNHIQIESIDGANIVKNHGIFFGTKYPPRINSLGNHLRITFRSVRRYPTSLFKIQHTTDECGGILTETEGFIYTPFFPNVYNLFKNCIWEIRTPNIKEITLDVHVFYVGEKDDQKQRCPNDKLSIKVNENGENELIEDMCGWKVPFTETFVKDHLLLSFISTTASDCLMNISYRTVPGLHPVTTSRSTSSFPLSTMTSLMTTTHDSLSTFETIHCWDPMCDNCSNIPKHYFHLGPCNEITQIPSPTTGVMVHFCPNTCEEQNNETRADLNGCSIDEQLRNFCSSTVAGVVRVGRISTTCDICYYSKCNDGKALTPFNWILLAAFILIYV